MAAIEALLQTRADIWHAHTLAATVAPVHATGHALLDAELPGGGWPTGALSEVLQPMYVHSEWRLLATCLARCGRAAVVLVEPPFLPFAPALAAQGLAVQRLLLVRAAEPTQRLWSAEQALRCADVDAVLVWLLRARPEQLRRLHLAAQEHTKLLVVLGSEAAGAQTSAAVLRLWVAPTRADPPDTLEVRILKRRGPPLERSLHLGGGASALAGSVFAWRGHVLDRPATAAGR